MNAQKKKLYKKIEAWICIPIIILLLLIIAVRVIYPAFAPTKHKIDNIHFSSVKKLEGKELEAFIQTCEEIAELSKENPFYKDNKKITLCFYDDKAKYSIIALGKSLGIAMNFGNFGFINFSETDFINQTITGLAKEYNVRNVVDVAKHELTHIYMSKGLSGLDIFLIPRWKFEGIAECIATSSSYDIETGLYNFFNDVKDSSPQYKYFEYRLAVLYLAKGKNYSLEEILNSRDIKFKEVLAEIKTLNPADVLALYDI